MKGFKETLAAFLLASGIGISGCDTEYSTGTVISENGTLPSLLESSGAIFGNESVRIGNPTYVLQIGTNDGLYIANIRQSMVTGNIADDPSVEALCIAIEEGTRVRFPTDDFREDRIGGIYTNDITILP